MRSSKKRKAPRERAARELLPAIAATAVVASDFPNLLTPRETAQLLRTTTGTLAQWRFHRRYPALKYTKVGSSIRY